jgi:hypothetical protein
MLLSCNFAVLFWQVLPSREAWSQALGVLSLLLTQGCAVTLWSTTPLWQSRMPVSQVPYGLTCQDSLSFVLHICRFFLLLISRALLSAAPSSLISRLKTPATPLPHRRQLLCGRGQNVVPPSTCVALSRYTAWLAHYFCLVIFTSAHSKTERLAVSLSHG